MAHFDGLCREWCVLRSFLPGRQRNGTFTFFLLFLSRFSRGMAVSPTARASHGNVMQITTGTRWARTGNASASRRARAAEAAPGKAARVEPAARRDRFSRLLRGEISSCGGAGASWRGAGTRAFRSEIARCHAGGPRLSRPYPRRPRPPPTRWPWCMRPPTLVGARVPRARPAPRTRSDCRTSRAGGGPPGTSAPTTGPSHVPAVVWGMNGISRRSVPK